MLLSEDQAALGAGSGCEVVAVGDGIVESTSGDSGKGGCVCKGSTVSRGTGVDACVFCCV